jgi:SagB-type dehydrogenase family enzyme
MTAAGVAAATEPPEASGMPTDARIEKLPPPDRSGTRPFEALLQERLSVRAFAPDTLPAATIGQLLWAAGGETRTSGRFTHRTIPSAGALHPLELYVLTPAGIGHYDVAAHAITWRQPGDRRADLAAAALGQRCLREAPLIVVISAVPARTTVKYGRRGERYATMEAGFACQNLLLEAVALGLGAVPVGAYDDDRVRAVLGLPAQEVPLLLVPVGRPAAAPR